MGFSQRELMDLQFSTSREGYDKEEVESFLDALAEELSVRERETQRLKERSAALSAELRRTQERLKRGEERREKNGDADAEARELIEQARLQAKLVLDRAKSEAQTIVQEAKEQGELIVTRKKQEQAGELRLRPLSQRMYSSFVGIDPRFAQEMPVELPQTGELFSKRETASELLEPAAQSGWRKAQAPGAGTTDRRDLTEKAPHNAQSAAGQASQEALAGQRERLLAQENTEKALGQPSETAAPIVSSGAPEGQTKALPDFRTLQAPPQEALSAAASDNGEETSSLSEADGREETPAPGGNVVAFPGAAAVEQREESEPAQQEEASGPLEPAQEPDALWRPEELRDPEPPEEFSAEPWELSEGEYPKTDWLSDPEQRYAARRPWEEDPDL